MDKNHKDMCLKEIGLHLQSLLIFPHSIMSTVGSSAREEPAVSCR